MILIVMGVSGSGKTTVGKLLAERIGYEFLDADDFHPPSNIAKMEAGKPLDDKDRLPWLEVLRDRLNGKDRIVLACSALKQSYREILRGDENVTFIYLKAEPEFVKDRLNERKGHFMKSSMLDSQFDALEEPKQAITIDAAIAPEQAVEEIRLALSL